MGLITGALQGLGEGVAFLGKTGIQSQIDAEKQAVEEARQMRIMEAQQKFQVQRDDVGFERDLGKITLQDQLGGARDQEKFKVQREINDADIKSREKIAASNNSATLKAAEIQATSADKSMNGNRSAIQSSLKDVNQEIKSLDAQIDKAYGDQKSQLQAQRDNAVERRGKLRLRLDDLSGMGTDGGAGGQTGNGDGASKKPWERF